MIIIHIVTIPIYKAFKFTLIWVQPTRLQYVEGHLDAWHGPNSPKYTLRRLHNHIMKTHKSIYDEDWS